MKIFFIVNDLGVNEPFGQMILSAVVKKEGHTSEFGSIKIDMDLIKKVETLKKIIESGRAARKKANIKVRQPLSDLKIYENDSSITSFILDQQQIILDELNIKTISIVKELKDMGSFSIKPNFKILSSKFDEDMQTIVKYIATLDQYHVMDKYLSNEKIASEEFDIIKEDIIIQIEGHEKEEAFFSNDVIVSISTEIDENLAAEGLIRELIRHIQVMRKEADFILGVYGCSAVRGDLCQTDSSIMT